MPQPELQCPFCQPTSPRPQGLASQIRNAHPKQYPKWLKTPTRLADAQSVATPPKAAQPKKQQGRPKQTHSVVRPAEQEAPVETPAPPAPEPTNPALDLLNQAHAQLIERKQSIEADLARMADPTKELETVNAQIDALDKTLGVF